MVARAKGRLCALNHHKTSLYQAHAVAEPEGVSAATIPANPPTLSHVHAVEAAAGVEACGSSWTAAKWAAKRWPLPPAPCPPAALGCGQVEAPQKAGRHLQAAKKVWWPYATWLDPPLHRELGVDCQVSVQGPPQQSVCAWPPWQPPMACPVPATGRRGP